MYVTLHHHQYAVVRQSIIQPHGVPEGGGIPCSKKSYNCQNWLALPGCRHHYVRPLLRSTHLEDDSIDHLHALISCIAALFPKKE